MQIYDNSIRLPKLFLAITEDVDEPNQLILKLSDKNSRYFARSVRFET